MIDNESILDGSVKILHVGHRRRIKRREEILTMLSDRVLSANEIRVALGIPHHSLWRILLNMEKSGVLVCFQTDSSTINYWTSLSNARLLMIK